MRFPKLFPVKFVFLMALVIAVILSPFLFKGALILTPERIKDWLGVSGPLAPLVYVALMSIIVATPIPSLPLNFAAGIYFGPILGTLYSVTGATIGALVSFSLARFLGRDVIERYVKGHINFCTPCSDRLLTKLVLLARLIPVLSFDLISYGAGLTKMSVRSYVIANFFGMLPLTFVYNYFGALVKVNFAVSLVLGLLFMALFFLLPLWIERYDLFSLRRFFQHVSRDAGFQDEGGKK